MKSKNLGQKSVEILLTLRDELDRGVFTSGSRLPTEKELCERFHASRPTIRRAIARLADEGRITVRRGSGMFVAPNQPQAIPASRMVGVMYPFSADSLMTTQRLLLKKGYLPCIYNQSRDFSDLKGQQEYIRQMEQARPHAMLTYCSPLDLNIGHQLRALAATGVRIVHLEPYAPALPEQSYYLPDYREAGKMAAMELMLAGYDRLVYLSPLESPAELLAEEGFARVLDDHSGGYDRQRNYFCLSESARYISARLAGMRDFVSSITCPTGFLTSSPVISESLLPLLKDRDLQVPEDAGIITIQRNEEEATAPCDCLEFKRLDMLIQAIEIVTRPAFTGIHELTRPRLLRRGTVGE